MTLMRLSHWDPFRDMLSIQDRLNRFMADPWTNTSSPEGFGAWLPPVDVLEREDSLVFRAEIPGVSRDGIDIRVENGTLEVRGEKKQEKEVDNEGAHRVERFYGTFSRRFALPTTINTENVTATYKDGVLEIALNRPDHTGR